MWRSWFRFIRKVRVSKCLNRERVQRLINEEKSEYYGTTSVAVQRERGLYLKNCPIKSIVSSVAALNNTLKGVPGKALKGT